MRWASLTSWGARTRCLPARKQSMQGMTSGYLVTVRPKNRESYMFHSANLNTVWVITALPVMRIISGDHDPWKKGGGTRRSRSRASGSTSRVLRPGLSLRSTRQTGLRRLLIGWVSVFTGFSGRRGSWNTPPKMQMTKELMQISAMSRGAITPAVCRNRKWMPEKAPSRSARLMKWRNSLR